MIAADYRTLRDSLERAGVLLALPELHGGMCGAMCIGGREASNAWLEDCVRGVGVDGPTAERISEQLDDVELATWQQLSGSEMQFEPLLPDDDAPLEEQVEALAAWCQGFLAGLGGAGLRLERGQGTQGEVEEIVADFAEISRAGVTGEERGNLDEAGFALAELKEYVRVGAQIVFDAFADRRSSPSQEIH
ncbi:MAG TPA: UPF0149 family protein [Gammaproteobacteria bacterium]